MDVKEKLLKSIEDSLDEYARWARRAGGSRSDAVEEFYRELLNRAFGYELKNLNRVKGNYPGIDLADEDAGVAVQVTTTETAEKVRKTLKQFLDDEKGLYRQYPRLIVAVAGDSKGKSGSYVTRGFDFQPGRDIWDIARLVRELYALPQEKLEEIEEFLRKRTSRLPKGNPVLQLPTPEWRSSVEFLGREAELAWIEEELHSGTKPVVIAGLGGIGKTALAVKFRRRWEGQVYFARFDTSFTRTLADSVGMAIPPQERRGLTEEQTAFLALSYLRRCEPGDLLIVDNAEVAGKSWAELTCDPFYEKIRRLPMAVLMTTRHRDTGGRWLGRLDQEDLREIFRRHEVTISEGEMDALINAVDGHTMTVDMIARTIRESWGDVTAETILTAMETSTLHAGNFDDIENDHDPEQGKIYAHLRALFDLSGIGEDGRQALRCATLLPQNGMDAKLFRTALPEAAATEIKLLEKKGWVDLKEGLVTIHPVVRLVCRTELEPTDGNCWDFLIGIASQYDEKQYDIVKFRQMAELFETVSNVEENRFNGFWIGRAGYFWLHLAEYQRALDCNLSGLERWKKVGVDTEILATAYNNVGCTYGYLGNHEKALEYQLKALEIRERILPAEHSELAGSYNNIGCTYDTLGDHEKALGYKLKALKIGEHVLPQFHQELALLYSSAGLTCNTLGNYMQALEYQLKALKIFMKVLPEDHPNLATAYNNVGIIYGGLGGHEKELEYYQKALGICERVLPENHPDLALSYNNIAWTYHALGQLEEAAEYMRRAADIINRSTLPEHHRDRVNFNKWAEEMEEEARQARGGA